MLLRFKQIQPVWQQRSHHQVVTACAACHKQTHPPHLLSLITYLVQATATTYTTLQANNYPLAQLQCKLPCSKSHPRPPHSLKSLNGCDISGKALCTEWQRSIIVFENHTLMETNNLERYSGAIASVPKTRHECLFTVHWSHCNHITSALWFTGEAGITRSAYTAKSACKPQSLLGQWPSITHWQQSTAILQTLPSATLVPD